jgi:hypothetical protein
MDRRLLDYAPVLETFGSSEFERDAGRSRQVVATPLDDTTEFAMAAELLGVTSVPQLNYFLADVITRAGAHGKRFVATPSALALVDILARVAQPILRQIRHGGIAGPVSGAAGVQRGIERAARLFGLELEGLSPEDKEFALARQFVRMVGQAGSNIGRLRGAAQDVAARALRDAAREYGPGLLKQLDVQAGRHGRWIRQGNRIVILDC